MTTGGSPAGPDRDILLSLLEGMLRIRCFEEKIVEVYGAQDMKSPVHLYIGEEAIAAGVCAHLRRSDFLFTTHRSHGHCLAKGMDPRSLYAEFYGRVTGCCGGKGGSMHPADPEIGILGTTAIVGGGIPLAVGAALATSMKGEDRISVCFFGDGASEEGTFHESLSFAALKRLPVIFICENNYYATTSPLHQRQPNSDIYRRAQGYDIPSVQADGNDVLEVHRTAGEAVARARGGGGPTLLEFRTYRWKGHVGPDCDFQRGCRPRVELIEWMNRCPIRLYKSWLLQHDLLTDQEYLEMADRADLAMSRALETARGDALPTPEELLTHLYFTG